MPQSRFSVKAKRSPHWVYALMLGVSAIAHAAILMLPLPQTVPPQASQRSERVQLASPPRLATPKPTTSPAAIATPKPTTSPTAIATPKPTISPTALATPQPTTSPTAIATPKPTISPTAIATPKPTISPTPIATPQPSPNQVPSPLASQPVTPDLFLEEFLRGWETEVNLFGESWTLAEIVELFGQPEQAEQFLEFQQPKPEIVAYYLIPEKTPQEVYESAIAPQLNLQAEWYGSYGGGEVYAIPTQPSVSYLNLVPLNPGSGTLSR
ncbi:hypothetical protein H6G20_22990 [Desertifilum sp. FACHB-1129]|uniref:hypothetical protein n=1 Tax=unclassified Desertifilum TaxID=2621682 RepID=UPI0016897743|nr:MULTISPECIES: hypothetical protein [unclassified Desertifilum]MBD2314539.1 hypothetical protein [Desertifilum sp. FACHB-1129]MBD2321785.1 hypothetical protein [Desertifilum sp. FACHB-866]MBD2331912.1 hypothetical protein [Desertifilum sp. FACHB-868]MDA0212565.1 hypothetical protein [Cyanobacteria bacterium FC1]